MLCLSLQSIGSVATVSEAQAGGTHSPPAPRSPPSVLSTSPTACTSLKRPASSHGPPLAAIVESSLTQSQQDREEQNSISTDNLSSRDNDWVLFQQQISAESAESSKSKMSASATWQASIEECAEATEDLMSSIEGQMDIKEQTGTEEVDLEDIDAIVAEFEQIRKQSEAQDDTLGSRYLSQRSKSDITDVRESKVEINNAEGIVVFKPKKRLSLSKSLPVQISTNTSHILRPKCGDTSDLRNDQHSQISSLKADIKSSDSPVTADNDDNLLVKEQEEVVDDCVCDKVKRQNSKKKRSGYFFNKWINKDKTPGETEKSQQQNEQSSVPGRISLSENDLSMTNGKTVEPSDQNISAAEGTNKKDTTGGIMRRLSRIVKNQAEDSDDGGGASTPKKGKSPLDRKICFIDLSMEDVPKHPPNKKMTYGDHVHVGMCLSLIQ